MPELTPIPDRRQSGEDRRAIQPNCADVEAAFDRKLRDHEEREATRISRLIEIFEKEAFTDGASAHKASHQAVKDAAKAQEEFWRSMKIEIAKKSMWGILQILTILVVAGLAAKFGIVPLMGGAIK